MYRGFPTVGEVEFKTIQGVPHQHTPTYDKGRF